MSVKESGCLFNAEMVRALLDGRKSQTRRPVKYRDDRWEVEDNGIDGKLWPYWPCYVTGEPDPIDCVPPLGNVGDLIWARETWASPLDNPILEDGPVYRATDPDWSSVEGWKWRPSIHMPKWAARIWLEITNVRVERVRDISEEDAIAEGAQCAGFPASLTNRGAFAKVWISIYGQESWENGWCWVYEFRRVERK